MQNTELQKMIDILKYECDVLQKDNDFFMSQNEYLSARQALYAKHRIQDVLAKAELLLNEGSVNGGKSLQDE